MLKKLKFKLMLAAAGLVIAVSFLLLAAIIGGVTSLNSQKASAASAASSTGRGGYYVEHWSGSDAYHSNFLAQRYGITAEQIDGFIKSQGITVDARASGEEFLKLQQISGIDVRMLVAFAQWESSYGTAGVAKSFPDSNLFGFGAFDSNPDNGANWDNTKAVLQWRSGQIDTYHNTTLAICDERAQQAASGSLPPGGAVYWSDTDGTGKKRAGTAEAFDKYIDEHGGTPAPPGGYGPIGGSGGGGGAGLASLDQKLGQYEDIDSAWGAQCYDLTAYYVQQISNFIPIAPDDGKSGLFGDAAEQWTSHGWTIVKDPTYSDIQVGDVINVYPGHLGTDPVYGHTEVVGKVLGDGKFIVYTQNPSPIMTREVTYTSGDYSSVIHPPK